MNTMELKLETLDTLDRIYAAIQSPDWHHALEKHRNDKPLLREAYRVAGNIASARFRLQTAILADIAKKLAENEHDLEKGIAASKAAVKSLDDIKKALEVFGTLVAIIGRVVTLIAL